MRAAMLRPMPRQILTIELEGLTAGDYVAHVCDPEPPALGHGLRSITVRAEPRGTTVEALLVWEGRAPAPHAAALAAGLPLVAEVVRVDATEIHELPAERPAPQRETVAARQSRLAALTERAAQRLAAQPRPPAFPAHALRWA